MKKNIWNILVLALLLVSCEDKGPQAEPQEVPADKLTIEVNNEHGWLYMPNNASMQDTTDYFHLKGAKPDASATMDNPVKLEFFGWNEDDDYHFKMKMPKGDFRRCILTYTMCGWNQGPSQWDMLTEVFVKNPTDQQWYELQRVITPYGGTFSSTWKRKYQSDVSHLLPILQAQDSVEFKVYYGGFDATDTHAHAFKLNFDFYKGNASDGQCVYLEQVYNSFTSGNNGYRAWAYGVAGHSIEDASRLGSRTLRIPAGVKTLVLRACFTGHGQEIYGEGGAGTEPPFKGYFPGRADSIGQNPAEFDENWYTLHINGTAIAERGHIWEDNTKNYAQAGTYQYNRAGWGPGKPANIHYWRITGIPAEGAIINLNMDLDEYVSNRTEPNANYVANYYVMVDAFGLK